MWAFIMSIAGPLLAIVAKMLGGGSKSTDDAREEGRQEQQNATLKGELATARAGNDAARNAESQPEPEHDPHDRSLRG